MRRSRHVFEDHVFEDMDSVGRIARARQAGLALIQAQVDELPPEGWSLLEVDLAPMLAAFAPLSLAPGYKLAVYFFRDGRESESRVWAAPVDVAVTPFQGQNEPPSPPPGALTDPMRAIRGDGSPWSYLAASLLARELRSFAAFGHGAGWSAERILFPALPEGLEAEGVMAMSDRALQGPAWSWNVPRPQQFAPSVAAIEPDAQVQVVFYTYSGLGGQRILRHTDRYPMATYVGATLAETVATAPGGYTW